MSHGKILQISLKPIAEDDFITEDCITEYEMNKIGADSITVISDKNHYDDAISWILEAYIPKGMFEINYEERSLTPTGDYSVMRNWFQNLQREFISFDYADKNFLTKKDNVRWALEDMNHNFWFHFEEWSGGLTSPLDLYWEMENYDYFAEAKLYYGGIIDYHV